MASLTASFQLNAATTPKAETIKVTKLSLKTLLNSSNSLPIVNPLLWLFQLGFVIPETTPLNFLITIKPENIYGDSQIKTFLCYTPIYIMNLINSLVGILVLAILITIGYRVVQVVIELNSPVIPKTNTTQLTIPEQSMSSTSLRWNHFPLTVYIDDSFIRQKNPEYATDVIKALDWWEETGIASFSVVYSPDADISIEWVPSLKEKATDTLGNTDILFFNISQFGVIQNAKVQLLTKSDSRELNSNDMVNLALHEIGHAIGLQHTNEDDIMNPVLVIPSKSVKEISTSNINNLKKIYELPAKSDLKISEVNATKFSFTRFDRDYFYLNISISLQNVGLVDAENFNLRLHTDNIVVNEETVSKLELGNILNVFQGNLKIDRNFTSVQVNIDPQDAIDELNETNNFISISV